MNVGALQLRSAADDHAYVLGLVEHHHRNTIPFLSERCGIEGKTIFEMGAGTGALAIAAVQAGARSVMGVEPGLLNWQAGVQRVRAYGLEDRVTLVQVPDTTRVPIDDDSYDVCVCSSVLQYVPGQSDRAKLLGEMHRVARPGGAIAVCASGNGIFPISPHTQKWWSNLMPRRAAALGHAHGVTYRELCEALLPLGASRIRPNGPHDSELRRWHERAIARGGGATSVGHATAHAVLRLCEETVCRGLDAPIEALLPFLAVAFRKDPDPLRPALRDRLG
jgi:ubiquinone/menaquinone biosynthesis C-methylase UbiE